MPAVTCPGILRAKARKQRTKIILVSFFRSCESEDVSRITMEASQRSDQKQDKFESRRRLVRICDFSGNRCFCETPEGCHVYRKAKAQGSFHFSAARLQGAQSAPCSRAAEK